jgi:hypothetical protein
VVNREAKKQRGARLWRPTGISRCAPSLICALKEKKDEPVTKSPLQQRQILTELNTAQVENREEPAPNINPQIQIRIEIKREEQHSIHMIQKLEGIKRGARVRSNKFFITNQTQFIQPRRSPSPLPHLIRN